VRTKELSDADLDSIERQNEARLVWRRGLTSGTWEYDSLGFIDTVNQPVRKRMGVLVRRREWFEGVDMDAKLKRADNQAAFDGQYIAAVCTDNPEHDITRLIAEIRRLKAARPN